MAVTHRLEPKKGQWMNHAVRGAASPAPRDPAAFLCPSWSVEGTGVVEGGRSGIKEENYLIVPSVTSGILQWLSCTVEHMSDTLPPAPQRRTHTAVCLWIQLRAHLQNNTYLQNA